ncbi:MAG TPA: LysR family transcriptional regulator, partial [Caldimonas sp.]|nr:LysR family transcriptional regulator [Caldimonas sp.]
LLEAIHRTASVSAAALEVGLSQPAASHALARMRRLLGDELFVRSSQGMVPTWYGKKASTAVAGVLRTLREGLSAEKEFDPLTTERIFRVCMSDVGQLVLLPKLLAHFRRHSPGARLHVEHFPKISQGRAVELGDVDLAIGHIQSLVAGFRQRTLFIERYVCVASGDNVRFAGGMNLQAFSDSPHAMADSSGMAHWVVDDSFTKKGVTRRRGLVVPEFMTLPFVIAGSEFVVTMPSRLAERFAKISPLRVMPPPVYLEPYPIRMFWHESAHKDPGNVWLRRALVYLFARAPAPKSA